MATAPEILAELEALAEPGIKRIFMNHGAPEDCLFGVKVENLKKVQKRVQLKGGKNHALALALFDTGNSDAMYLAGLMADEKAITKDDLQRWAHTAPWHMITEYSVAWVAAESPFGLELALEWIHAPEEHVASAGWATLGSLVALIPDEGLDLELFRSLLQEVELGIRQAPNRVRYTMNSFVIAVGSHVAPLHKEALQTARAIGKVQVFVGDTACKVPEAPGYIEKMAARGSLGKKKKTVRC